MKVASRSCAPARGGGSPGLRVRAPRPEGSRTLQVVSPAGPHPCYPTPALHYARCHPWPMQSPATAPAPAPGSRATSRPTDPHQNQTPKPPPDQPAPNTQATTRPTSTKHPSHHQTNQHQTPKPPPDQPAPNTQATTRPTSTKHPSHHQTNQPPPDQPPRTRTRHPSHHQTNQPPPDQPARTSTRHPSHHLPRRRSVTHQMAWQTPNRRSAQPHRQARANHRNPVHDPRVRIWNVVTIPDQACSWQTR